MSCLLLNIMFCPQEPFLVLSPPVSNCMFYVQALTLCRPVSSPGIMNLPAVALGIITGGTLMKRLKLSVLGAARISLSASFISFCLMLSQYFLQCDNAQVAGLTVNYQG